jgi:hypothetical protein
MMCAAQVLGLLQVRTNGHREKAVRKAAKGFRPNSTWVPERVANSTNMRPLRRTGQIDGKEEKVEFEIERSSRLKESTVFFGLARAGFFEPGKCGPISAWTRCNQGCHGVTPKDQGSTSPRTEGGLVWTKPS